MPLGKYELKRKKDEWGGCEVRRKKEEKNQKRKTLNAQRPTSNIEHRTPNDPGRGQRPTATGFLFPTLISSTAVEQESAERGVPCASQGEHGGQCYEAASATGAEP